MTSFILTLLEGLRFESSSKTLLLGGFDFEIAASPLPLVATLSCSFVSLSAVFDFAVASELKLLDSSLATILSLLLISVFAEMSTLLHVDVFVFRPFFGAVSSTLTLAGVIERLFFLDDSFLTSATIVDASTELSVDSVVPFTLIVDDEASTTAANLFVGVN